MQRINESAENILATEFGSRSSSRSSGSHSCCIRDAKVNQVTLTHRNKYRSRWNFRSEKKTSMDKWMDTCVMAGLLAVFWLIALSSSQLVGKKNKIVISVILIQIMSFLFFVHTTLYFQLTKIYGRQFYQNRERMTRENGVMRMCEKMRQRVKASVSKLATNRRTMCFRPRQVFYEPIKKFIIHNSFKFHFLEDRLKWNPFRFK